MRQRILTVSLPLFCLLAPIAAGDKKLTLEALFHPDQKLDFDGKTPPRLRWLPDGRHYLQSAQGEFLAVDAVSGDRRTLLDRPKLKAAFASQPGFSQDQAEEASQEQATATSKSGRHLLFDVFDDLFAYDTQDGALRRLTDGPERELEADFSPDEAMVSFVRDHDIYLIDLARGRERRLTRDGNAERLNGRLDWVYQEEIYGRGDFRAYWWSPDSTRIAYLQLDEAPVPRYSILDLRQKRQREELMRYPKAGDPNPGVRLGVVSAAGGETRWVDDSAYQGQEILVVSVGWNPSGTKLVYQIQDREQTWLHLNVADAAEWQSQTVVKEESPAWVDRLGDPHWLSDGSFLWQSQRTGWRHLYRYSGDFGLKNAVTQGEWEVSALHGADEDGWAYFSGTERSHIGLDVYRIRLDGTGLTRLSQSEGAHRASFNDQCTYYIDTWSDLQTPPQIRLHRSDGNEVRTISENKVKLLDEYDMGEVSLHQVKTRDGFLMEAMLIKPSDFDPSKSYPVMSYTYSGPHAPQVRNAWGGARMLWHRFLAQEGYLVWVCDNRTASGKGIKSAWPAHGNLGTLELQDLEDGLSWLKQQPYIDQDRIGLWGWSYGGYMTSFALTHSKSFKIGIAGAPVTDWELYDTIYTERYMGRPQTNPEGYRTSSPLKAAADLHGKLLVIHGTIDDNVHMQNTIQFIDALQKAGKDFELMLYPGSRHGVRNRQQVWHLYKTMTRFVRDNL